MPVPTLPLVDLSEDSRDAAARARIGQVLDDACRRFGFFHLVGHGMDWRNVERLESLAREFFAWDEKRKMSIAMAHGGRAWRGYFPLGGELTSGQPDWKEGIYFGTELDETDDRVRRGLPLHGRNLFPDIPGFREALSSYIDDLTRVSQRVLAAIALGLGLSPDFFVSRFTADPTVLFRIFNYPPPPTPPEQRWGVGEHTDYGLLTLLKQDRVGGLQVRHGDAWIDVPYVPESFVCNVGDMLERLTSGRYLSALHRARNGSNQQRLSLAFFFDPSFDATLEPIAGLRSEGSAHTNVRWDSMDPNTVQGTYGDYLLAKIGKVFPELRGEVLDRR